MSTNKNYKWLINELPRLVAEGVLDETAAERLRAHYRDQAGGTSLGMVLLGILGAALIGFGVILLFAHNWPQWSREVRTVVAFLPLVAGQLAVAWCLLRRQDSVMWREGSAVLLTLAIGASIALVEQTYHYGSGDPASFLMAWSLLALPLIYLLDASAVALLFWGGICGWAVYALSWRPHGLWFWPVLALSLPHVWRHVRDDRIGLRSQWLLWGLGITLLVGLLVAHDALWWGWRLLAATALFASALLAHGRWLGGSDGLLRSPARSFGALGVAGMSLLLAFDTPLFWLSNTHGAGHWSEVMTSAVILFGVMLLWAGLWAGQIIRWRQHSLLDLAWSAAPLMVLLVCLCLQPAMPAGGEAGALLVANGYVLALGGLTLRAGMAQGSMARLNGGMGLLCVWILIRFFDSDLPFVLRGVVFVVLGAAFLFVNWRLRRKVAA